MGTAAAYIKKRLALWGTLLVLGLSILGGQILSVTPAIPLNAGDGIELTTHKEKCDKYEPGSRKRLKCKEDCGRGPRTGYAGQIFHPVHPNQCRNW